jgi:hypothetical protein
MPPASGYRNHSRVADTIVQRPPLLIEERHDEADQAHYVTQDFCEVPPGRSSITDFFPIGGDDTHLASHLPKRCPELADHKNLIARRD